VVTDGTGVDMLSPLLLRVRSQLAAVVEPRRDADRRPSC